MSFAFLYPLAWLGALAVAAPIWLHLRRKTETDVIRFSAMRFLDDQQVARARPLWPHNWPLMLLRILAILLLIAAFSWPYLPTEEPVFVKESRVYVLDNTLSHQTNRRFERARDQIVEELGETGPDVQVAVIELTSQPRLRVGYGDSRSEAAAKLSAVEASHQRGSYLAAFRMAQRLLRQSLGAQRRIVFMGDSQENQWAEGRQIPPFLENVEVTLPEVTTSTIPNLSLAEPEVRRLLAGDRAAIECTVSLCRHGDFDRAAVVFRSNGEDVFQREIELTGQPESLTLSAQWEVDPTQWVRGEIRLDEEIDALPADNRVVFSLPPVRRGRVGLLARSPFLQTALSPDVMQGRWQVYAPGHSNSNDRDTRPSENDVLCVESHYLEVPANRDLVLDFLDEGRGVVLLVDRTSAVIAGFLQELGIEALAAPPDTSSTGIRYFFMEHEIFRPFRSSDFGDLTEITAKRYRRLSMPGALPLAFSESGDPLIFESERMKGRLLILAFTLDRTETNWPLHSTFVPFLDRCLSRVRSATTMQTVFEPGETCIRPVPAVRGVTQLVLRRCDETDIHRAVQIGTEDKQVRFNMPDRPGLYALSYNDDLNIETLLAVNPPTEESILSYVDSADLINMWKNTATNGEHDSKSTDLGSDISIAEVLRQDIWWWLVLGGLAALFLETSWLAIGKATT